MASERPILRVGVRQTTPWTILTEDENKRISVGGLMGDIVQAMSDTLQFDYMALMVPDNEFGIPLKNGSWTGMIGMIQRGEADFALGPFGTSYERETVIDFTIPVIHSNLAILSIRPKVQYDIEGILKTFSLEVWLGILFSVVTVSIVLGLVEMTEKMMFNYMCKTDPFQSIMLSVKAITQEGSPWLPERDASRILVAFWLVASLIFVSSFSGILTAMLTVPKVTIPIDSLKDMVSQSKIPWRMIPGTFLIKYFQESDNKVHQKAYKGISGTIPSAWAAREDVMEGKYAIIAEETGIKTIIAWDFSTSGRCHLYQAREYVYSNNLYSIAFQTNSSYLERANRVIRGLMESGILYYWHSSYFANATQCLRPPAADRSAEDITALNIKAFGSSFILMAGGHFLALVTFVVEKVKQILQGFPNELEREGREEWQGIVWITEGRGKEEKIVREDCITLCHYYFTGKRFDIGIKLLKLIVSTYSG
ncbi:probable glutamate receptor [Palaemon carinicauda]|uniref:probable glutamate receptor n=1 Tax=Palaemon carinicauda TaxID=392227 RepID=UPI0035B5D550